jgi:magnesium transporter
LARTRVWRKGVLEAEDFPVERVSDYLQQPDAIVWADLCLPHQDDLHQMAEELGLAPLAVEDAVASQERPKLDRYPTHLFLSTYAMSLVADQPLHLTQVSAFVLPQALVTVHRADFDIDPVVKAWDDGLEMVEFGGRGLLYGLLDVIVDGYLACLQQLDDQIEDAEDRLFDDPPRSGTDIQRQTYLLRRQLTGVRKVVLPMRDVADAMLRHAELHSEQPDILERLRDLRDHVIRANEWNDALREVIVTMFETGLSLADARLNQIVRKLSGWAAIIAVPTAVTGFYGQNLPYPGYQQWWGFLVSTAVIVVLAVGIWMVFHRRGWL